VAEPTATGEGAALTAVLLGTGHPLPDPNRAGAATLLRTGARRFLVDGGRGVCLRRAAAGTVPILLERVFLTHLHSGQPMEHNADLWWRPVVEVREAEAGVVLVVGQVRVIAAATDCRPAARHWSTGSSMTA
jgi:ribonuclease BN (tRNA processing enzyme)